MDDTDFVCRDRAVFFPDSSTLVLADLHLGRSRTAPIETPMDSIVHIPERLADLVEHFDASRVIIAGDVLDAFETVPPGVPDRFDELCRRVRALDATLTLLRGNHDTMLDSLYDGEVRTSCELDGTIVCHGHEDAPRQGDRYVIGHEHPAIRIEGAKRPCFLHGIGVDGGADVLVLPAFSQLVRGTAFNVRAAEDCFSPIVRRTDLGAYRPIVSESSSTDALTFPPLRTLRRFL